MEGGMSEQQLYMSLSLFQTFVILVSVLQWLSSNMMLWTFFLKITAPPPHTAQANPVAAQIPGIEGILVKGCTVISSQA
jgi:hypothetical protein